MEEGYVPFFPTDGAHASVNKVSRELRRTDLSLRNCLLSVEEDAQHVSRLAALLPGLPVVANLRCGLWYAPEASATAYFKSTDGHSGNWSFSTARLNWHVAELAAGAGGLLLVDATRSATKRFPDALSKTVPIWAAVLNAAVAVQRGLSAEEACAAHSQLTLPPWVAPSEAAAIQQRIPAWLATLLALGVDLPRLAATLARPLRCLWLSQASPLWALPDAAALPFTPILCVSASAPLLGHGQRHVSGQPGDGGGEGFVYVPGAGDDEESWACGLTAQLFARHRQELLRATAGGEESLRAALALVLRAAPEPGPPAQPLAAPSVRLLLPSCPALSAQASGRHDLPPRGVGESPSVAAPNVALGGICQVGGTGLALTSFAALRLGAALWESVDAAMLLCDGCPHASALEAVGLLQPQDPAQLLCVRVLHAHGPAGEAGRASLLEALPALHAFAAPRLQRGERVLIACADGCERAPAVAMALLHALFSDTGEEVRLLAAGEPPAPASKLALRRWLALVSAHAPQSRPTRGLLKQAFQHARSLDSAGGLPPV